MNKEKETVEDIYLQKKLLEAAATLKVDISNQDALDQLVFVAKQCMPEVFKTIIQEYNEK